MKSFKKLMLLTLGMLGIAAPVQAFFYIGFGHPFRRYYRRYYYPYRYHYYRPYYHYYW